MPTSLSHVTIVLVGVSSLLLVGCGQLDILQARRAFREANALYAGQDYRGAAAKYEEAIAADPNLAAAYFFLGNSYDNLYQRSRRGDPANDKFLTKAIENYYRALALEQEPKVRALALAHLVAAYGPDKLNDPSRQEPLVLEMIRLDPGDATNYFALAKIYEDSGDAEGAERALLDAKAARPREPAVYIQLADFLRRQGEFDRAIAALQDGAAHEPNNPQTHHLIATYYWDKIYRDPRLGVAQKLKYIEAGVQAADRAIQLKSDYVEAIAYKNLLLRLEANLERDPDRQQTILREADRLRDHAEDLRKKQQVRTAGE